MALTAYKARQIKLLWRADFDTYDIARELDLREAEVYQYIAAIIEMKKIKRGRHEQAESNQGQCNSVLPVRVVAVPGDGLDQMGQRSSETIIGLEM